MGHPSRVHRSEHHRRRPHRHRSRRSTNGWGWWGSIRSRSRNRCCARWRANPGTTDVRGPRSRFADFPRTEFRLYASEAAARSGTPALVVFYLGAPGYDAGVRHRGQTRGLSRRSHRAVARRRGEQEAMTRAELARLLDHSVLKPEATEQRHSCGCGSVRSLQIGFYCVQPCWVKTRGGCSRACGCACGQRRRLSARVRSARGENRARRCSRWPTARARSTW